MVEKVVSVLLQQYRKVKRQIRIWRGKEPSIRPQVQLPCVYHGSEYGGWSLCPDLLSNGPRVYSAGVGEDITFDIAMVESYGARVFAFDPTPRSRDWVEAQSLPEAFTMVPIGIAGYDGVAKFFPPENPNHVSHSMVSQQGTSIEVEVRRLKTIMQELGHQWIDVLKLDIEGAEYDVLEDVLVSNIVIPQILVEFHHRHKGCDVEQTRATIHDMNQKGYRITNISPNGEEYTFVYHGT